MSELGQDDWSEEEKLYFRASQLREECDRLRADLAAVSADRDRWRAEAESMRKELDRWQGMNEGGGNWTVTDQA